MHIEPTNTSSYAMLDLNDHEHEEFIGKEKRH